MSTLQKRQGRLGIDPGRRHLRLRGPRPRHVHHQGGPAIRLDPDAHRVVGQLHRRTSPRATTVSGLAFGNFQNVTISGLVYNDFNGDGAQEPGEPGLAKWNVQLLNSAGKVVATATTDAGGTYSFTNLGPGTYKVQEVLQTGWILTSSPSSLHGGGDRAVRTSAAWPSATSSS